MKLCDVVRNSVHRMFRVLVGLKVQLDCLVEVLNKVNQLIQIKQPIKKHKPQQDPHYHSISDILPHDSLSTHIRQALDPWSSRR